MSRARIRPEWLCCVLALSAVLAADDAAAQTATTPKVFFACYVPGSGVVYRIKEPNLPQRCHGNDEERHIEFSWTDGVAGSDHGSLNGLGDDDHTQYLLTNGVRNAINGFAVTGTLGTGTIPASGVGVRLMWYPGKAAFRAGVAFGTNWEDANIGLQSIAFGSGTIASGSVSTAMGFSTDASGGASTAMGSNTTASAGSSTAMGNGTTASGGVSTAMGSGTDATGAFSTAMGDHTTASGAASTAMGVGTLASGFASTAMGSASDATGNSSFAAGSNTRASGRSSVAMGQSASTDEVSTNVPRNNVFVFGDGLTTARPTNDRQFVVSANGGVRLFTTFGNGHFASFEGGTGAGCRVLAGNLNCTGAITAASDAAVKMSFEPIDAVDVLAKLAALRVQEWSYRADAPGVRHVGPTAQDFHAAFGLGQDNRSISTLDASGINTLAIQALEQRTREIGALRNEVSYLRSELDALRAEFARVMGDQSASKR